MGFGDNLLGNPFGGAGGGIANVVNQGNGLGNTIANAAGGLLKGGLVGGAISLIPAAFKFFNGISQRKQANKINPINPGYQMNNQVIDNARILGNNYTNYQMPGYNQALNNLNTGYGSALAQGTQGASSGGDVLDLASKLAYGQGQNLNSLAAQSAQGKQNALNQYLSANAMAGQEYVNKNAYDRDQYDAQLRRKAALEQGGATNEYGALDQTSNAIGKLLTPIKTTINPSQSTLTPQQIEQFKQIMAKYPS